MGLKSVLMVKIMTKIDPYIEHVNGIVIGDLTRVAAILSPNKIEIGRKSFSLSIDDDEIKDWASEIVRKKRNEAGEEESHRLGWDRKLELRIYS